MIIGTNNHRYAAIAPRPKTVIGTANITAASGCRSGQLPCEQWVSSPHRMHVCLVIFPRFRPNTTTYTPRPRQFCPGLCCATARSHGVADLGSSARAPNVVTALFFRNECTRMKGRYAEPKELLEDITTGLLSSQIDTPGATNIGSCSFSVLW